MLIWNFTVLNVVLFILQLKETGFPGEIFDALAGVGNKCNEPGICYSVKKQKRKTYGHNQKDIDHRC